MKNVISSPAPFYATLCTLLFAICCANVGIAHSQLGTVEFKSATVGDAVRILSEMSQHHNIVATEAAKDLKVSLYLKDATIEGAIDGLCRVTGLWYRRDPDHDAYYVMTEEEFNKNIVVSKNSVTRIFELKHQNVSDAAYAIESLFGGRVALTEPARNGSYTLDGDISIRGGESNNNSQSNSTGSGGTSSIEDDIESRREFFSQSELGNSNTSITVSEEELINSRIRREPEIFLTWNYLHNLLLVRSSDKQALAEIANLITRIDRPAQQILLEVQILQATLGNEERSIFDYRYQSNSGQFNSAEGSFTPDVTLGLGRFPEEGGAFLARISGGELTATIEWLRRENRINLLSQPNIISANNKEAKLVIGEDRVLVTGATSSVITSESSTVVSFTPVTENQNIGTELTIWPRINGDKTVTLDIEQSNTSLNRDSSNISIPNLDGSGITNIAIDTVSESTIELTAIAKHGTTIAIGGMIDDSQEDIKEKVPLLGDVPVLGKLFRKDFNNNNRRELIVLITPWISENPESTHIVNQARVTQWSHNQEISEHLSGSSPSDITTSGQGNSTHPQPADWPQIIQKRAINSIRHAVSVQQNTGVYSNICQDFTTRQAARFSNWQLEDGLVIDAKQHCDMGPLFLTQATLRNTTQTTKTVKPSFFKQGWIATSGEKGALAAGQSRTLYLVSQNSPEKLLKHAGIDFYLSEGVMHVQ